MSPGNRISAVLKRSATGENTDERSTRVQRSPAVDDSESPAAPGLTKWGRARIGVAYLLAVGSAVLFVVLRLDDSVRICHDSLAQTGDRGVVRVCDAIGLTDFAPVALVIALLLLPDISELSITGLGSIKTRVAEAEVRHAELAAQVTELRSSASAVASPIVNVNLDSREVEQVYAGFQADLLSRGVTAPELDESLSGPAEQTDAELRVELLELWDKRLWPRYEVARRMRGPRWRGHVNAYVQGSLSPDHAAFSTLESLIPLTWGEHEIGILADWAGQFAEEIKVVREGRNAVAHPRTAPQLDLATLRRLVAMGGELADVLDRELAV